MVMDLAIFAKDQPIRFADASKPLSLTLRISLATCLQMLRDTRNILVLCSRFAINLGSTEISLEEFVKPRFLAIFCLIITAVVPAVAQTDSVITQVTSSNRDSYAGSISGDGRFVVFESTG